jgi:hypothetical protein
LKNPIPQIDLMADKISLFKKAIQKQKIIVQKIPFSTFLEDLAK